MGQATAALAEGTLKFSVEARILRELGERLVKQPEVALIELIKNAYDADATTCEVNYREGKRITIADDGHGMTLTEFRDGWMRIATRSKETLAATPRFRRVITGEKGIGRFAVRFLGTELDLRTVAEDHERGFRTLLSAQFDWRVFDKTNDLEAVEVPYTLTRAGVEDSVGTTLKITKLRESVGNLKLDAVRTAAISVVTPFHALLESVPGGEIASRPKQKPGRDPGFSLVIKPSTGVEKPDVARAILDNAVIRAQLIVEGHRVSLEVSNRGSRAPKLRITDTIENSLGSVRADIRFFPQQRGTFVDLPVDGRAARRWIKANSGVAVFDRGFRVLPYGTSTDDWLFLAADTAARARDPRSSLALKHFPMDESTKVSTQLNYMLRLPYPGQLVGVVNVQGRRSEERDADSGLVAAADREGFIDNRAFRQLRDLIRGAVEAIASVDRELQQEQERAEEKEALRALRSETRAAIREIRQNPNIRPGDKARLVKQFSQAQALAEKHEELTTAREASLETMSLLGVVAGFMTHEFGLALDELEKSRRTLTALAKRDDSFRAGALAIGGHVERLQELATYTRGYVHAAPVRPARRYPAKPRIQQIVRIFGKYASRRGIEIESGVDSNLLAPRVPVSLYSGVVLNLFTNALKAVIAKANSQDRKIKIEVSNDEKWHWLEVSDTGIGIPTSLRKRVFEPLFTTTASNEDPLGSGMGLGLSLVKRAVESYGGRVEVVNPQPGFATCVQVRLPLEDK